MADQLSVDIQINVVSEPFEDDPPFAADFYEALGKMTLLWGRAEHNLDRLILIAIQIAAKHGTRHQLPVSLEKKLDLLRRLYSDVPELKGLKNNVYSLATAIGDVHQNRSAMTHSNWDGFSEGPPKAMIFFNISHRKGRTIRAGEFRLTLARINKTLRGLNHVNSRLMGLILNDVHRDARKALYRVLSLDRWPGVRPAPNPLSLRLRPKP
jgi:hypothetical protein